MKSNRMYEWGGDPAQASNRIVNFLPTSAVRGSLNKLGILYTSHSEPTSVNKTYSLG